MSNHETEEVKGPEATEEPGKKHYKFLGKQEATPIQRLLRPEQAPSPSIPIPDQPQATSPIEEGPLLDDRPEDLRIVENQTREVAPRKKRSPAGAVAAGGAINTARLGVREGFEKHMYQVRIDYVEAIDKIAYQERTDLYQVMDRALAKYLGGKEAREILEQVDAEEKYPGYELRKKGRAGRKPGT
jgi:hypothetical protein